MKWNHPSFFLSFSFQRFLIWERESHAWLLRIHQYLLPPYFPPSFPLWKKRKVRCSVVWLFIVGLFIMLRGLSISFGAPNHNHRISALSCCFFNSSFSVCCLYCPASPSSTLYVWYILANTKHMPQRYMVIYTHTHTHSLSAAWIISW